MYASDMCGGQSEKQTHGTEKRKRERERERKRKRERERKSKHFWKNYTENRM